MAIGRRPAITRRWVATLLWSVFCAHLNAATLTTDGSLADVQIKVTAASDGDTVTIPPGVFWWGDGVTEQSVTIAGKSIHLQGAGAGRIFAHSLSDQTLSEGTKTFTIIPDPLQIAAGTWHTPVVGETLQFERTGWITSKLMQATVTSYDDATKALVVDVFLHQTDADYEDVANDNWSILTLAETTIISSNPNTTPRSYLLRISENDSGSVEVSGIRFVMPASTGGVFYLNAGGSTLSNPPTLIHDCYFRLDGPGVTVALTFTHHGLVWNCSFAERWFSPGTDSGAFQFESINDVNGWSEPDTLGMHDSDGRRNFYIEDCDFHSFNNVTDLDIRARVVVRHCLLDHAGLNSHGPDPDGSTRHGEVYNNVGYKEDGAFIPNNWWVWMRAGTWVITDNDMPSMAEGATTGHWGPQNDYKLTNVAVSRSVCWGAGAPGGGGITLGTNPEIVSISASNPAIVTTATPHGMTTGQEVRFAGSDAAVSINDVAAPFVVTRLNSTQFSIPVRVSVAGTATGTVQPISGSPSNIVSITNDGYPAIVTTSTAHGLITGAEVQFSGSDAVLSFNGLPPEAPYAVTVLSSTTFSIPVNVTVAGTATGKAKPVDYPTPRQVGWGHDGVSYIPDPIYIWSNSGGINVVSIDNETSATECGADRDWATDYIKAGRDYFLTARPGYVKYTYPHPLRTDASPTPTPSPQHANGFLFLP